MKAAVSYEYNQPIEVVDIQIGDIGPRDIRVQVKATGLCHSDVAVQTGALPFPLPMILGHEGAGIVLEVGDEVTQTRVGDHVVLSALIHCGVCDNCVKGRPNLCLWGLSTIFSGKNPDGSLRAKDSAGRDIHQFASIGTLAEELICSEKHAVPIDKEVPFEAACLTGCGVLTGMSAVLNRAKVQAGKSVVVLGCGGVGLNVIQTAAMANAGKVVAVDLHEAKLAMAREFGATHSIQSGPGVDVPTRVRELTGGMGADYVFEVVGIPEVVRTGWDSLCVDGTLVAIGVHPSTAEITLPAADISSTEKTLMACLYGTSRPTKDIPLAIGLYQQGRLKLDELITHHFALEDINEAVEKMHQGQDARGVVVF
ncbi:MAG: alcohol dehydrogenase catalytic domain-containing protein [Candidatus Binatia bacterium]|nr:alcohol dehydrogenase catalytic domain-containing protein [Candidatus Binatia bacterium]